MVDNVIFMMMSINNILWECDDCCEFEDEKCCYFIKNECILKKYMKKVKKNEIKTLGM